MELHLLKRNGGVQFLNLGGEEIARIIEGDKFLPNIWDEISYSSGAIIVDNLFGINYKLIQDGSVINGDIELIMNLGELAFRRKYSPGCGAIVNFSTPNLQGTLSLGDFDPNLGFSGVFDLSNNKFILHPSADHFGYNGPPEEIYYKGGVFKIQFDPTNTTTFTVNRTAGHITGNSRFNDIFAISNPFDENRAGFAVIFESHGFLRVTFSSNGLNPNFHPPGTPYEIAKILPENLQLQVMSVLEDAFPNFQLIR